MDSSQAAQSDFILTQRLADGNVEWVPMEVPQRLPADPGAAYTLIDRARYEAPEDLQAARQGDDLVVEVAGSEVLVLEGFFITPGVTFHPTTDIASGAGPFAGTPLTPESTVLAGSPAGEQVVWSAEPLEEPAEPQIAASQSGGGGSNALLYGGLAVGGLGLLAAAGGGGGGGGGDGGGGGGGTPPPPDDPAPEITSGTTADPIAENSGAGQLVYTATATDNGTVTWSLAGADAASFSIDDASGEVTLLDQPDFETKPSYNFTVVATDDGNNTAQQAISLDITDQDDNAPVITSGTTAPPVDENSGAGQVVYTATATDDGTVTWSLTGADADSFSIDAASGAVTLLDQPDFETQSSYSFTVVATDDGGNSSQQAVGLEIIDQDDDAPIISSGFTAGPIDENSGDDQVVYTATATDDGKVTWSLESSGDVAAFDIDDDSGEVTLNPDPDHETKSSYTFTVVATDDEGNTSRQPVTLTINDLDEVPPAITSGGTAAAINENSGANQVVYTVAADDSGDISGGVTFSLASGGQASSFTIDGSSGAVRLTANPDHETRASYNFTVVATDAAGNSSQRAVSLAINDLDDTAPTITSSATATPVEEDSGAGQVVYTVTSTDTADVSTGSTTYSLSPAGDGADFSINQTSGAVTLADNPDPAVKASYTFTVIATDAANNSSQLTVTLNVINQPPTLEDSTPDDNTTDVAVGDNVVLTFSENVQAGSGNIVISNGAGDTRTIAVTDGTQVSFSGNQVTINPANNLLFGSTYNVQIDDGAITDATGTAFEGIDDSTTLNFTTAPDQTIVVFDLVQGSSSDHSGRTFQLGESYDIFIRVDSDDEDLSTAGGGPGTWDTWAGTANLGSDDRIILVGDGATVRALGVVDEIDVSAAAVAWLTDLGIVAARVEGATFTRNVGFGNTDTAVLFDGALPAGFLGGQEGLLNTMNLAAMPAGILTSQGLA